MLDTPKCWACTAQLSNTLSSIELTLQSDLDYFLCLGRLHISVVT